MFLFISYKKIKRYILLLLIFVTTILVLNNRTFFLRMFFPVKYDNIVYEYSMKNNLDPYLVFAIIKAESNFDPDATSHKSAKGLMQITDETAYEVAKTMKLDDFKPEDLYHPEKNIMIGTKYLRWLLDQFNNDTDLAIAAYNAGIGNVKQWLMNKNLSSNGITLEKIPFKETDRFVVKVKRYHKSYKYTYGSK